MQELCSTTTEERENIISCFRNHITVGDHHSLLSHDTITAFTVDFFDMPAGSATKQLRVQLLHDPHSNTYEWQSYMTPVPITNQCYQRVDRCFVDRNTMIEELVMLLNSLGFPTPPQMW